MRKKTGNKLHTWEAALLLAVAAALLWGACTLQRQDALEQKVVRLHVIANSDSEADQALKLRERDRVLVLTEDILRQSGDMEEARQRLAEALAGQQSTKQCRVDARHDRALDGRPGAASGDPRREGCGIARREGEAERFGQAVDAELRHQVGAVHFHRARRDAQIIGDRLVRVPAHQPAQHIGLARGERGEPHRRLAR